MSNLCSVDTTDEQVVVVMLPEKMTMATSTQITSELKLVGRTGNTILDFGSVNFVDSSGLAVLVKFYKTLDEGEYVVLANIKPHIVALLELTRLTELFIITDSVFHAKEYITKKTSL